MQIEQKALLDILGIPDAHFRIPIYQRVYSWTQNQCAELWADLERAAATDQEHFLGTVLYGESSPAPENVQEVDLVDGQQRLVTTSLLLAALSDAARESSEPNLQALAADINERYLFTRTGSDPLTKLELSHADQPTFAALLEGRKLPEEDELSVNITTNYQFFKDYLATPADIQRTFAGLERFTLISARLEPDDQPQSVFESLNAKGRGLSSADLIRNLLFATFGYEDQKRIYEQYWQPIEGMFQDDADTPGLLMDAALHAWLDANTDELNIQDRTELYGAFKRYVSAHPDESLEELLASINAFCATFAEHLASHENKVHIDWAKGKLTGLISERKLFGD